MVQWKGWEKSSASWEPAENLTPELREQMEKEYPNNKYDNYEIAHVKQPRKQSKRSISPDPPSTVRSDPDHASYSAHNSAPNYDHDSDERDEEDESMIIDHTDVTTVNCDLLPSPT